MATNTIAGVNPTRISGLTIEAMQTYLLPIFGAFTTNFSADLAASGNAVTTRYVTNPTVQDFSDAARASQNSATTARTIELNRYVGVDVGFNDTEQSFSDIDLMNMFIIPAVTAIGENVITNVLTRVTVANFAQNTVIAAANFTAANIAVLAQNLNTAKVPLAPRHIVVPPSYAVKAKTDTAIQAAYAYGSPEAIRTGRLPDIYGFQMHEYNGNIPNNSQNLAGFATAPQGLLLAARQPVLPRNWNGSVTSITEPRSGLTIQWRDFYDDVEQRTQFCVIYGSQIGNPANLWRITSS
jgi:hypothetical protein